MNVEILEKIASDNSRAFKETWIAQLDEDCKYFVKLALDPDVTFGVTVGADPEVERLWHAGHGHRVWEFDWVPEFKRRLERLRLRQDTGGAAQVSADEIITSAPTSIMAKWAGRIINRNLRAGFDIKTYNRVFQDEVIAKFAVQLADAYGGDGLRGLWFFQPKLDGNRVVFIDGRARSRSGKYYENCEFVVEEIEKKYGREFWDKWVIDGEMMGDLGFDQSSGALRRTNQKGRKRATFTYFVFDLVDRDDWDKRRSKPLIQRRLDVETVLAGFKRIQVVPTEDLTNPTHLQIMEICKKYVDLGFEGAMAKQATSAYEWKRGHNILKVKLFKDVDARVVPGSYYPGRGRNANTLGGFFIETDDGIRSKCGGGFSDAMRDLIWNNQKDWDNAIVQVQYFEKTKDGSLRFPVFIMRRKDKEGDLPLAEPLPARRWPSVIPKHVPTPIHVGEVVRGKPMAQLPDELPEDL